MVRFRDHLPFSHEQGRFIRFSPKKEVNFAYLTQLFGKHKKAFHTSTSKDFFSSCFVLDWRLLEMSSPKLTGNARFGHLAKM